jgi:hypothetical protein
MKPAFLLTLPSCVVFVCAAVALRCAYTIRQVLLVLHGIGSCVALCRNWLELFFYHKGPLSACMHMN